VNTNVCGCAGCLSGYLDRERFGLAEKEFWWLADTVDIIIHNAAEVSFVAPYHRLRGANVLGTAEVIRLATCRAHLEQQQGLIGADVGPRGIPIHYVSTISVVPQTGRQIQDEPDLSALLDRSQVPTLSSGYAQSKWVAEHILAASSRKLHFDVCIYRVGIVLNAGRAIYSGTSLAGADTSTAGVFNSAAGYMPPAEFIVNVIQASVESGTVLRCSINIS